MRFSLCILVLCVSVRAVSRLPAQTPIAELSVPGHNLFVNQINAAHRHYPQIKGEGITISIKEFRFDSSDVDFKGRFISSGTASNVFSTHASIIGVLAAGAGTTDPASLGVAPGARISSSTFAGLKPDLPADYTRNHISVQSHAYGSEIDYSYSNLAQSFDQSTLENPYLVHVFSAGNKGAETMGSGLYSGIPDFATITGSFKMAKNILTVGAVDSFNRVQAYSSKGPDYAGRIKPELVAFGGGGSSESAALVSGAAALVQQAYVSRFAQMPRAELVRATLLSGATDIANPGPDYASGYGNLNVKKALHIAQEGLVWQDSLQEGSTANFTVPVSDHDQSLKITLAWNDPPAEIGVSSPLLHDLDLRVTDPNGQIWYPFVLSSFPDADSLAAPATQRQDTLNNTEQVFISQVVPGDYSIQVQGRRVMQGRVQPFALATDLTPARLFEWSCPVSNDPVLPGEPALLRWTSSWPASSTGHIAWKNVDAPLWITLDTAVLLQNHYLPWKPEGYGLAQVRVQIGTETFVSDTFLIAPPLQMKVGFDCPDSTFLFWEKTAPNAGYQVWGLGDQYLEPLFVTHDSAWVFSKDDFPQTRFAVSPVEHGIYGMRSAAPAPDRQGAGCYIAVFFAELMPEQGLVQIGLQLGTFYNAQSVAIEKEINGTFSTLFTENADSLQFEWEDLSPLAGINRYRAKVLLRDGRAIYSDILLVYAGGTNGIRIFPNPFTSNGVLHIVISNPDESTLFQLFDIAGREIWSSLLPEIHNPVQLPEMQAGTYFWRMGDARGKLIVTRTN